MGTAIYLLYVMGELIYNIPLHYVIPSFLLYKIFVILIVVVVYMYRMTMTYSTSCGHLPNLRIHKM
jgi:hypothetical protein